MGITFRPGPGGKGSNQAIAAAGLGRVVNSISKVGTDSFGELAKSFHRNAGIHLDFLITTPDLRDHEYDRSKDWRGGLFDSGWSVPLIPASPFANSDVCRFRTSL